MMFDWDSEDAEVVRVDGVSYLISELGRVKWWWLR